jgi:single-strand DNA-binding protein
MASFNKVMLLGNLTRDPELKYAHNGSAITAFGLAVNQKSGEREETLFVDVTTFGKTAELANQYLGKGSQVLLDGRLRLEQWEKDGQKRSKLSVIADRVQFLSRKDGGDAKTPIDDDIPV